MTEENLPIEEGDRVDHKMFGGGTVLAVHGYALGAKRRAQVGWTAVGYRVDVAWDDPERKDSSVMSWALAKVSFPDARPFIYWDKRWQPLRETWLQARREVEQLYATFRPVPDEQKLVQAMKAEAEAWAQVQAFLVEEETRAK
ncbi:hypothetical protein SAMN04244579_04818 [Azotobacter beijerinckii]|uniref:Uncharacterized protein n=1 Tax=Azotobacter beijerinckii TaxID=170623 RepID=A0A1H6ZTP7_9GAMM|nr:hypothetical protein [Azotobacter beijerinckii]SEJ56863.1 hypothetical protein SAMN04244579_04818 [Azotobacter beijerinckii]